MAENDAYSLKIVALGDGEVGKTCLLFSYANNEYPIDYKVTVFENYAVNVTVDGLQYIVAIFDTAGQADYSKLRYFCYPKTDLFLLCFSVVNPSSFDNVITKWLPDIRAFFHREKCAIPGIILVGTKIDLREDSQILQNLAKIRQKPIRFEQGEKLANEQGLAKYLECSALTQAGVKRVFDEAIADILQNRNSLELPPKESKCSKCALL